MRRRLMVSGSLGKSSRRYLVKHPWLFVLSIIGVALGVSVVISIDIANESARTAFALSSETVTGKATHQIVGTGDDLPEEVYRKLRVELGVRESAPVLEGYVSLSRFNDRPFQLFGIDPLAEGPFRSYLGRDSGVDLAVFMVQPGSMLISERVALDAGLALGDTVTATIGGNSRVLQIAGLLKPADERSARAMENLLVVDIAAAQELLDKPGALSRIDLIAPAGGTAEVWLENLRTELPDELTIIRSSSRTETIEQMTEAFNVNLTALSLLALVVGMFLIYNTMTFSVVQRRTLIGQFRALGVTRREIGALVLGEALLIGILGTAAGLVLGILMGKGLVGLVTQTINDLYYVVAVRQVTVSSWTLGKGIFLGVGATVLASSIPAREATRTTVSTTLRRSHVESHIRERLSLLTITGIAAGASGLVLLILPLESITLSYLALLFIILGFALITPGLVLLVSKGFRPLLKRIFGLIGSMSAHSVVVSLSRTSVAIAALMIAVAASVGVGIMVDSFRQTVVTWLEYTLQADIYVQPPSPVARRITTTLHPDVIAYVSGMSGVRGISTVRQLEVTSPNGIVELVVTEPGPGQGESFRYTHGDRDAIWNQFSKGGGVLVSEPFAYDRRLAPGDSITLQTDQGMKVFPVAGIRYDYSSDQGSVLMHRATFERFYHDRGISGVALYVEPGEDVDTLTRQIEREAASIQQVVARSNRGLRETSLEIFDRTFTITAVLRLLAVIVAFVGILSALMALQLERTREFAVLRASGLTPAQVWWYVTMQTGLMGFMAGLFSLPLGALLAYVLIYVINRRSFGWTLQIGFSPDIFIQAVLVSIFAALLAGLYPALRMSKANPSHALRDE